MAKFDETPINKDAAKNGILTPPDLREHAAVNVRCWPSKPKDTAAIDLPTGLVPDWQERAVARLGELLDKNKALRVFMDICVRCGACADKCQYYLGTGDPQNMPVARAELLRAVYRRYFTLGGRLFPEANNAADLDEAMLDRWYTYFYQCSECRRCSVFCPYGIDTAEITMMGRELLHLLGLGINWAMEPVANCFRTGNHLGIQPHGFKDTLEFFAEDIENITGIKIDVPLNKKGAEILFVTPSGDYFGDPGTYTCMGYMMLFHELGLDYTWSTYATEGGNFGLFTSHEMIKRLNAKIYAEAKRLGVKWILGGECGHMWRVMHQYMDTMNGPADFLEMPTSPITGTRFENTKSTKMVHIMEFTADLIRHNKLRLDPGRNNNLIVTFHDSCNPARAMGIIEEPRYVIRNVCNHFYEMPENTIKEQTFCCGGGAGLGTDENLDMRLRGGFPRGNAVRYVQEKYGVNRLACMCAIDRATLIPVCDYWAPGVLVTNIHEMVANALVMKGEKERTTNLRGEPLPGKEE